MLFKLDAGHSIECKLTPATGSPSTGFCTLWSCDRGVELFDITLNPSTNDGLPPESSVTPGSSTTDSRDWCTRSYTGCTSLSESVISWAYWLTGACSAKRQCTCPTVVSRSPKSQHVVIYAVLHIISWPFHDIVNTYGRRCCWSDDVQHSAKWSARPLCQHSNLRTVVENTPFLCLSARLAH